MRITPVLLDARPPYLGAGDSAVSLLLLPTGAGTVLSDVAERAAAVTPHAPLVLPRFEPAPRYVEAIRREARTRAVIVGTEVFRDPLARFDPADALLIVSVACYPIDGIDLQSLVGLHPNDLRMMRHLLAFEADAFAAKEFAQQGADGRLRRVQRYFDPMTWPIPAGVVASLVPVACVLFAGDALSTSLAALRTALSAQGMASQDVPYHGRLVDLTDEAGALALVEHRLVQVVDAGSPGALGATAGAPVLLGGAVYLDSTARFVGPVIVADGAVVEAGALVIGPTLLGRGTHIGRHATVAQCLVTDGARIAHGVSVRHRVVTDAVDAWDDAHHLVEQRRHARGAVPSTSDLPPSSRYPLVKAVVEPVLATILLILLAPVFLAFAVLIVVDTGRPVFFGHKREGRGGVPFRCWKFRTMRRDADSVQHTLSTLQQLDGPQFKMARDPRVTRAGRWLRRLNVDELPQLWNIVRGQMSFVGPRPSPFEENQICIPWRYGRLSMRPGITGLWQVCRYDRAAGDFHQWIHYDLLYVRHASLRVDLRIVAATLLTLGGGRAIAVDQILPGVRGHSPRRRTRGNDTPVGQTHARPVRASRRRWAYDRAMRGD